MDNCQPGTSVPAVKFSQLKAIRSPHRSPMKSYARRGCVIGSSSSGKPRKIRFNWNVKRDVQLLHAVLEFRPWDYGESVYEQVLQRVGFPVTSAQCKLHFSKLCQLFKRKDIQSLRKSGTEEEYSERDWLLQEVTELEDLVSSQILADTSIDLDNTPMFTETEVNEALNSQTTQIELDPVDIGPSTSRRGKVTPKRLQKQAGDFIRKRALDNSLEGNSVQEPTSTRGKRVTFEEMIQLKAEGEKMKFEQEQELKTKEVELKMSIEQKRLEMEERLAIRKLELEHEDKERQRDFMRQQQAKEFEQRESANSNMLKMVEILMQKK